MGRFHFGRDPALADTAGAQSGTVRAIGTATEPIIFRGQTAQTGWYGIVVSYSPNPIQLEYVTIRDTFKDDPNPNSRVWKRGGAIGSYQNSGGTIIRHCVFINNRALHMAGAIDFNGSGSQVEISDSHFEGNSCDCALTSAPSTTDLCGGGAVRFSHVAGNADKVKIVNNRFLNNQSRTTGTMPAYGGALAGFDNSIIIGPGNVFSDNSAGAGDGAISCTNQTALGNNFVSVDPSCTFANNVPNNGCGL
jgi:hypothetical protein